MLSESWIGFTCIKWYAVAVQWLIWYLYKSNNAWCDWSSLFRNTVLFILPTGKQITKYISEISSRSFYWFLKRLLQISSICRRTILKFENCPNRIKLLVMKGANACELFSIFHLTIFLELIIREYRSQCHNDIVLSVLKRF